MKWILFYGRNCLRLYILIGILIGEPVLFRNGFATGGGIVSVVYAIVARI